MLDLSPYRKNKINLEDYDYKQDIKNRVIMSRFSQREKEILEEILYSPPKISLPKLAKALNLEVDEITGSIENLMESGLFHLDGDMLIVNKEMKKYFESHSVKFEEDFFIPNMEFLQALLKKVPIHVLPNWYHIPRTSNNIFDSLIEKYFSTPQIFQRYLKELNLGDDVLGSIVQDVFNSPDLKVTSKFLREKLNLEREEFEEHILHLEFNFVCCLGSEKVGDTWEEIVTPFQEWRQYLLFLRDTTPQSISNVDDIIPFRPTEYAFADDMATILSKALQDSYKISEDISPYLDEVIKKSCQLKYAEILDGELHLLPDAEGWLELSSEDKALQIFKHPLNEIAFKTLPDELLTEKNIREAEKSVKRIIDSSWVYFSDFIKGMTTSLSEENKITLKKTGKQWSYTLPQYTEVEKQFISSIIFEWLFEGGIISKGTIGDNKCIKLTGLGKALFE